jgi:hypothetical protein
MDVEKALVSLARERQKQATIREQALGLGAAAPRIDVRWSFGEVTAEFREEAVADGCPRMVEVGTGGGAVGGGRQGVGARGPEADD